MGFPARAFDLLVCTFISGRDGYTEFLDAFRYIKRSVVPTVALCCLSYRTMGDSEARSLGVNTQRTRMVAIICATAMTATAVSQSGAIGWVGLVVPHIARILVGPDHRKLLPVAATLGAAFLLIIDSLTRTVSESSLPLSIPIALVGAPFFAVLLRRSKGVWTR